MSQVLITQSKLDELALQVSGKSGEDMPLTVDEMTEAVAGIELVNNQAKTVAPSTSSQAVEPDEGYTGLSQVTVEAVSPVRTSSDLFVSGPTVHAPYGWYAAEAYKQVDLMTLPTTTSAAGTGTNKATIGRSTSARYINIPLGYNANAAHYTINAVPNGEVTASAAKGTVSNHSVEVTPKATVGTAGYLTGGDRTGTAVTVTASELVSGTKSISANGTGIDVAEYASVDVAVPTGTARTSADLTVSGATVTAPSGLYSSAASASVASGTEGTPTATKGTVSNHAISVTPSVTNSAGYISGGTHTGTAVSVTASELVSGTYTVDSSGTKDVTNYASASVAAGSATASATKGTVSNHSVSVTPSVTRTAGWVTAGSANGTAVTVSASELVSGSQTVTTNDTYDVTNLAELVVNVSGGGSSTMTIGTKTSTLSAAASSISFTGLSGNPLAFVVTSSADQATGGTTAVAVAYDGTSLHGMDVTTQAEADTGYSKTYSSGTLTITATTASFGANEYKLVYAYGGSSSDIHTADVQVGSGATSITFSGLSGRPLYFSCVFKSSFSTSSGYQRVIDVVNDGTSTYGHAFDSSAHAATSWSYTYSGGSLTISSTGTNNGGYFHQPGYYGLVYAVDPNAVTYQNKTGVGASTTSQTIYADSGYDALESVQINAVSQTNLTAANIKSGTTVTISNGTTNLWSVTGTYTGGGGGGASIATTTWTNSSNTATSHQFTGLSGTPVAAFLRCTSSLSRSSSSTNYFIADMVWDGSTCKGNSFRRSNGTYANVTSGYSVTTGTNSITFTSSGTSTTNPGSFYNGSYELVYVY